VHRLVQNSYSNHSHIQGAIAARIRTWWRVEVQAQATPAAAAAAIEIVCE
jgi:stage V sporulation protein SpoVS